MDLMQYVKIGLRWWWLIFISVALSAGASYIFSQRLPKIYSAKVTLTVGSNIIDNPNPDLRTLGSISTLAEVYSQFAKRLPVAQAAITRLGVKISPEQLVSMISTKVIPEAQLLEISVLDVNPQRAPLLANAVAEELILQSPTGSQGQQEREKFVREQLQDLQQKIEDTNKKIKDIEAKLPGLTSAVEIAEAQSKQAGLEQVKGEYQRNYTQFLSNLSENAINRLAIFEPASEPTSPISPSIRNNVLLAALAGLALAIGAIVLLEFFDDTYIWYKEKPQELADLPILGVVPKMKNNESLLSSQDKLWSFEADMLRTLRSSIFLAAEGQPVSTVLITSANPNEGKTFVTSNLAVITASSGSKISAGMTVTETSVILIDADLRNPSLHELFDQPNIFGLTDILAAPEAAIEALLKKALRPTQFGNLLLLPAGTTPLDPGALLNSPNLARILDILKTQADFLFIDSAPILEVVDTLTIANLVDVSVLVVSDRQSRIKNVKKVSAVFKNKQHNNLLGVVVNRIKVTGGYYGYYGYRSTGLATGQSTSSRASFLARLGFGREQTSTVSNLGINEVAARLGVSVDTARRWCEDGRLAATKTNRRWLVNKADLDVFIAAYQQGETHYGKDASAPAVSQGTHNHDSQTGLDRLHS